VLESGEFLMTFSDSKLV